MKASTGSKMTENGADEPVFEAMRRDVLAQALKLAPFDGWTDAMLANAAAEAGLDEAVAAAAFPDGAADLLRFWSQGLDQAMSEAMAAPDFAGLKIREKVAYAVRARLAAMAPHKEAARRAAATLALPHLAPLAARLVWATSDRIWRGLGDASTDFNFYSKRMTLSGVWASTFAHWLADDSDDHADTEKFLAARIENVMQIEKAKGKIRALDVDPVRGLEWLARLRYRSGRP